jgi:transcriptional regulator GlxA family with amidase domain
LLLEQQHADDNLGVEDFAKKCSSAVYSSTANCKAITNRIATEFIRDFRLERAHAMLLKRAGLVMKITLPVGFGNEKYFSTTLKEKFGVHPSQAQ